MGKRIIRISHPIALSQLSALPAIELNMILKNGVTLHGIILSYHASALVLKDSIQRKHTVKLIDIEEIVLDKASPY